MSHLIFCEQSLSCCHCRYPVVDGNIWNWGGIFLYFIKIIRITWNWNASLSRKLGQTKEKKRENEKNKKYVTQSNNEIDLIQFRTNFHGYWWFFFQAIFFLHHKFSVNIKNPDSISSFLISFEKLEKNSVKTHASKTLFRILNEVCGTPFDD